MYVQLLRVCALVASIVAVPSVSQADDMATQIIEGLESSSRGARILALERALASDDVALRNAAIAIARSSGHEELRTRALAAGLQVGSVISVSFRGRDGWKDRVRSYTIEEINGQTFSGTGSARDIRFTGSLGPGGLSLNELRNDPRAVVCFVSASRFSENTVRGEGGCQWTNNLTRNATYDVLATLP